ncbi:hypothetical protein [Cupriavidus basilensis]|uniref:Uncharacterized protein n=1 Tax=Cupriavidus basilensis TaxID=68895 RepID=A0A0C4YNR3_9BURK|nr:hypothetical protein [Cupriavidus basilensis]AJG22231.1 hypothetical protein RR42_s0640 [Cupriavidus basilensis]
MTRHRTANRRLVAAVLVSASLSALMVAGAAWWTRQHLPRMATVDLQAVLDAKRASFAERITRPNVTDRDRDAALAETSDVGTQMSAALKALQAECGCILLTRAAVIGAYADVEDLTPLLMARLGMSGQAAADANSKLDERMQTSRAEVP